MKTTKKWLAVLVLTFVLTGCGIQRQDETEENLNVEKQAELVEQQETKMIEKTDSKEESTEKSLEEAPEGYVYDYQVSMEPIPEDVAAYGGEVCGTIHAFPSKIKLELMRRELEKEEYIEVKEEAEKCEEEIVEALEKEYGGEFSAELMEINWDNWYFYCIEESTEYAFVVLYEYYSFLDPERKDRDKIHLDAYLDGVNIADKKDDFDRAIEAICGIQTCQKLYKQIMEGGTEIIYLYMASFCEEAPKLLEEQKKIKELWQKLKTIDESSYYIIRIEYFPLEYQQVMEEKCLKGSDEDMRFSGSEEKTKKWIDSGEMYDVFYLDELMDEGVEEYFVSEEITENTVWKYWIEGTEE